MKAVQINQYGGVEVLQINENTPKPTPKKGQVLVEVFAASINPFDWKVRQGYMKDAMSLPATLGGDFAGKVVGTGDEIYGSALIFNGGSGSFAQFAAVNIKNSAQKPKNVNFEEAAALPLVGSSAIQALEEHIKLQKGQKILIHGGAGGIGHIAVQLAKHLGAYVATTVGTDDIEFAKSLGADEVIDYKQSFQGFPYKQSLRPNGLKNQKFEEILKDFDAVFDTVGGETTDKSFSVLKNGGVLVSMLGQPKEELAKQYGVVAIGQGTETNATHLKRLKELVKNGIIKVNVDKVFSLNQVQEAFEYQEKNHPRGKVVLKIKV